MRLIASVIARNEIGRYWDPFVAHLLEFADEIRVWDDGSTDGGPQETDSRIVIHREPVRRSDAFVNHATMRQRLLDFTLEGAPTHILAIDADEFIAEGSLLRKVCQFNTEGAFKVCLQEAWRVRADELDIRQDGGWQEHDVALVWRPDSLRPNQLKITDKGHATGRTPDAVGLLPTGHTCTSLLHLGWSNVGERDERYARYAVGDAGKYHAASHIASIAWPDSRMRFAQVPWPAGLERWRAELTMRANR